MIGGVYRAMQGLRLHRSSNKDDNCLHGWLASLTGLFITEMKSFPRVAATAEQALGCRGI
eukprot:scaffold108882_cov20-Prasinocladus_malaysianus.AAC.2